MSAIICDVAVIGGGPAGLAAAESARLAGAERVVIVERDHALGGILEQCIHDGFGLTRFGLTLSGPEYAARYVELASSAGAEAIVGASALDMRRDRGRIITRISRRGEMTEISSGALVLATGCRERPRGALMIPGHRPSGVYTAGAAQRLINIEGVMPGRNAVILGSGDIGLIMARRMTLEGAHVDRVLEIMPWSSGLTRNIQQCLIDYGIPLFLSTTVVEIIGRDRVEAVRVARVDDRRVPIEGTDEIVPCDTLLLSVGLIPENELALTAGVVLDTITGGAVVDSSMMTSVPGIFSCGNALHVHDLVDFVSEEASRAGRAAAAYAAGGRAPSRTADVSAGPGVRYVVPARVDLEADHAVLAFRPSQPGRDRAAVLAAGGREIASVRAKRLHPAEMMRIDLTPDELGAIASSGAPAEVYIR